MDDKTYNEQLQEYDNKIRLYQRMFVIGVLNKNESEAKIHKIHHVRGNFIERNNKND